MVCAVFICLPAHLDGDVRADARLNQPVLSVGPTVLSLSAAALYNHSLPRVVWDVNNMHKFILRQRMMERLPSDLTN